jgi:hypothetical protein
MLFASSVLGFAACSLGLDESKISATDGGPLDATSEGLDAPTDVVPDAGAAAYTPCSTVKDCPAPNACTTPRCDDARKVCVYDQCPSTQACSALACDPVTLTCAASPTAYAFRAAQIKLPSGGVVGCNNTPSRCLAASWPFVFAGAASGSVLAYAVANPGNALPPPVPIDGLGFAPAFIVASGPRVWFFGTRFASNGQTKLPVAALDVPTDPTVKRLSARTVYLTQAATDGIADVFPVDQGAVLVVLDSPTSLTARLDTLPAADGALPIYPVAVPTNGVIASASGGRLVTFRSNGPNTAPKLFFGLVTGAGTASSQSGSEQEIGAALGPTYSATNFAPTANGGVMITANVVAIDDGGANGVKAVRLATILESAQATSFVPQKIDYETYPNNNPAPQAVLGAAAAIDANRAVALSGARADGGLSTTVQIVERSTLGIVADSRATLAGEPGRWAVAGANGFGYAFGVETSGAGTSPSLYVFAPSCK